MYSIIASHPPPKATNCGYFGKQPAAEDAAHHAGLLALRIFKEEIQAQENGSHLYIENSDQWCSLVCLYSPYLKDELQSIFNDIIKNKWIDYKDPYHHLSLYELLHEL